ncbi:MAG: GvpL/GvpF family gas vesicle protein [Bacteroidetes bacterium]|nr:GvpL/GvpF family gas vesicle protein [Bacteroidota bacterium]
MKLLIYAIVSVKDAPGTLNSLLTGMKGTSGMPLYSVPFNEVSVVVSNINSEGLNASQTDAIGYAGLIETLAQKFTLLPMRFGSVMGSTQEIADMLGKNMNEILRNLEKVEDKFEFGLKIFCDSEKVRAGLKAKSAASAKLIDKPAPEIKHSVYLDYVNQKLKEHRLEELLMAYVDSVIAEIKGTLARLNSIDKFRKTGAEKNIIDAVFLLDKNKKAELIKVVEGFKKQYPELDFILTGPWPPYSFIDITIK